MKSFAGKNIFLTGAATGIGRSLAQELWRQGSNLVLVDVDHKTLETVRQNLLSEEHCKSQWIRTHNCDLSKTTDVDSMLQSVSTNIDVIDAVINNAGVAYYGPTDAMTTEQWDWLMNVNLLTPIRIVQHFLPQLMTRPDAHIVNMCSISGLVAGGRFAAYHTSKFGLVGFTEALRAEYGRKGIGVTAICPGPVKTQLYQTAASGRAKQSVPEPPNWLCTTAEKVATVTVRAMQKNRRQVLITPMAHGVFQLKRFMPGLIDFANQFSRKKRKRMANLRLKEAERLQKLADDLGQKRAA